jgi:hypothetical protein
VAGLKKGTKHKMVMQAVLMEPPPTKPDTPEHFYYNELNVKSSLLQRAVARGFTFIDKSTKVEPK